MSLSQEVTGVGPEPRVSRLNEIICPLDHAANTPSIFFAGGITNCPDWQRDFAKLLEYTNLTGYNPRRENFPINDPTASWFQIGWERRNLSRADAVSFWFPKETVCPITLYELGVYTMSTKTVFLGLHPEYPLAEEVIAFTAVHRPDIKIARCLEELAEQVKTWDPQKEVVFKLYPPPLDGTVFFAGGIKGCPDWQSELGAMIKGSGLEVLSERDANFFRSDDSAYKTSLTLNHYQMMRSEILSFWFPKESINPVVLYELGVASKTGKSLFVGVEPGYCRKADVIIQMRLGRPEVGVVSSLEDLAGQINAHLSSRSLG